MRSSYACRIKGTSVSRPFSGETPSEAATQFARWLLNNGYLISCEKKTVVVRQDSMDGKEHKFVLWIGSRFEACAEPLMEDKTA